MLSLRTMDGLFTEAGKLWYRRHALEPQARQILCSVGNAVLNFTPGKPSFTPGPNKTSGTSLNSTQQSGDVCVLCGRYKGDRYQRAKSVISWNGDGWTLRLMDGSEIRFPESYSAKNAAQGAPTEILDANGNLLELRRDPRRNLQEIRTPHRHWMKFSYDGSSRIVRAEDESGKWARYTYSSDGMLTDVVLSSGRERHYTYQGVLMTEISDETKNVLLRNWYDHTLLIKQQFADGETYSYAYDWPEDTHSPNQAEVTLPRGTTKAIKVRDSIPYYVLNLDH